LPPWLILGANHRDPIILGGGDDVEPKYDLIIVGAGPVGLSLALGVCRTGKSVLVLEEKAALSEHSKAPVLWPSTLEVLNDLGIMGEFLARGEKLVDFKIWDVDKEPESPLIELSFSELQGETNFPFALILPQPETEKILLQAVRRCPRAEVRFSSKVTYLEQSDAHVSFTYLENGLERTVTARSGAGCDGAHSKVRELLGFLMSGSTYTLKAALADLHLGERRDYRFPRVSTKESPSFAIRIAPDLWRLILLYDESEDFQLHPRIRTAVEHLFSQTSYTVVWESEFKLHHRISGDFAKGRIALAGDAAHLNSPVGGQGMNAGIQDTVPLRRAILSLLETEDTSSLRTYAEIRRRKIDRGVNRFTDLLTTTLTSGHLGHIKTVMALAQKTFAIELVRHRFLRKMAMLSPHAFES
jgi:2-polyprenyl-6-methoxyphenol hydroxylase-like FAD-dependent oxidoreductase